MSDPLFDKIRQRRMDWIEGKKSEGNKNRDRILQAILDYEPSGVSTNLLVEITSLNHDTVSLHCKNLVNHGLITKKNKKGKYHLSEKAYGSYRIQYSLFKNKTLEKISEWNAFLDIKTPFPK